jgi:hypothetical protein
MLTLREYLSETSLLTMITSPDVLFKNVREVKRSIAEKYLYQGLPMSIAS